MKHFNLARIFLFFLLFSGAFYVNAQITPLAFGVVATGGSPNWYANYVGLQFEVTTPAVIAGEKQYTTANSGTAPWGAAVTAPIVARIIMDTTADSFGGTPFPYSMAGKIAVIWRGPEASAVYFSTKAAYAQQAGAIACVIINEYPGQGPIGMASSTYLVGTSGATCPTITIPVFMIGNDDGMAISGQYRAGVPVTMTITNWGVGDAHDVGFVPGGAAGWHDYAIPSDQLPAGVTLPAPYKGIDGAFIANYGTMTATNVKVSSTLSYTPNGSTSATTLHTNVSLGEASFTVADSIVAMFTTPEYDFAPPSSGPGRYDLTYTISSDVPNQNPVDTSLTLSFYSNDSIYSKGRYDFTNSMPISTMWESANGGAEFLWGNMYYVAHGHDAIRSIQFSLYNPNGTTGDITAGSMSFYVFKWNDGSNGLPADSIIQEGELEMVSTGTKPFNPGDTSGMVWTVPMGDSLGTLGIPVYLDSNSWYLVCADVPSSYFFGVDGGLTDNYPRVYGRWHASNYLEYNNTVIGETWPFANTSNPLFPVSFPGTISYVNSVDSVNYASEKGLVPSLPLIITDNPDTSNLHTGVKQINSFANINVYPNPANDYINISTNMSQTAPDVTYTIIDGLARFVTKETHYNVLSETFQMSTSKLASGTYYLSIRANGRTMVKKFTVIQQ